MHEKAPWTDVAFTGCYHNDPDRVRRLLEYVRPYFTRLDVGVQTDDEEHDETLAVCRRLADSVLVEKVQGMAEPTLHHLVPSLRSEWAFVVSADEWPSRSLLDSFQDIIEDAYAKKLDGYWIRFRSSIEGIQYLSEQDNHLRVFRSRFGWPRTMHSRPATDNVAFWPPEQGFIRHERSLDEMMVDYLRYYEMGRGNGGWEAHNAAMMHDACAETAKRRGWKFVKSFSWWPQVEQIAFKE